MNTKLLIGLSILAALILFPSAIASTSTATSREVPYPSACTAYNGATFWQLKKPGT